MIFYSKGPRFFATKADAKSAEGELHKIKIEDRYQIVEFLNALIDASKTDEHIGLGASIAEEAVPDYVPKFLLKDWK